MHRSHHRLWPLLAFVLLALTSLPSWAAICRVTTTGTASNDGSAWDNAHAKTLQSALSNSTTCSEIWVAKGVYKPVTPANLASVTVAERSISFQILPGVAVYGGFAGSETTRAQRTAAVLAANLTVLSGDIDGNDTNTNGVDLSVDAAHNGSNSNTVVQLDGRTTPIKTDTVLDGFTVTAGNSPSAGGGFYCNAEGNGNGNPPGSDIRCSPTVSNVTFSGNFAIVGGSAMLNSGLYGGISSPVLTDVVFSNNSADNGGSTQSRGGAMLNGGAAGSVSNPVLTNVTFIGNKVTNGDGGAMYNAGNFGDCSPVLNNVTFTNNSAINGRGGAMVNYGFAGNSSPTLDNVVFNGNSATGSGGAIYNYGAGFSAGANVSPTLNNVTFSGNSAQLKGGAMYNDGSSGGKSNPTLSNVTFSGNSAPNGGAVYNDATGSTYTTTSGTSSPTLNNVTFSGNSATGKGGAIYNDGAANGFTSGHSSPVLNNVILWGDTGGELFNNSATATTTLHYSVLQGGCTSGDGNTCTNIIITNPNLGPLANNGGSTKTMLPGSGSSAINAGNDSTCAATDQRGVQRPQGPHCDIGAVEVQVFFTVSGVASGQLGNVVLQLDGNPPASTQQLTVASNASSFGFTTGLPEYSDWTLSVNSAPSGQTCTVTPASGTGIAAPVNNVALRCVSTSTTTLTSSVNPVLAGKPLTLTATIASVNLTAGGTVSFNEGNTPLPGCNAVSVSNTGSPITAQCGVVPSLLVGTHAITAVYAGDTSTSGSTSTPLGQTVYMATSTTTLTSSSNPVQAGQPLTLTATVGSTNLTAGGTVSFNDGNTPLPGCNAVSVSNTGSAITAQCAVVPSLLVGTHSITAIYFGDISTSGSTSAMLNQGVSLKSTTISLTVAPNPSTVGQNVTFTAVVMGDPPTGTVSFFDGSTLLGTATLVAGTTSSTASLSTRTLLAGSHSIGASYAGDNSFASVSLTQNVNALVIPAPVATPTLSQWMLALLGGLIAAIGMGMGLGFRRRG